MFLIDTNIISELKKKKRANAGVMRFFINAAKNRTPLFLSAVTIGELRRGVEIVRHRGDLRQAENLEQWLESVLVEYQDSILEFTEEIAHVWGKMRVPHYENALDKQIAATAYIHGLTVVTRNESDFIACGVKVVNPFSDA